MQSSKSSRKSPAIYWLTALGIFGAVSLIASSHATVSNMSEIDWLNQLASAGDSGAQLQLGLAYREGRYGLEPDAETGLYWLTAAARGGNAYAADQVANRYAAKGPQQMQQAVYWWQQAAHGGNADADVRLGEYMMHKHMNKQALPWLRKAADRGDRRAHRDLASIYRSDDSISEADLQRGENRLAVVAQEIDSTWMNTMFTVWNVVKAGSTEQQSTEALLSRAQQGDPVAEYQLAIRYRDGAWAVKADPQKAMLWLQRSAAAGNPVAEQTLKEISHKKVAKKVISYAAPGSDRA